MHWASWTAGRPFGTFPAGHVRRARPGRSRPSPLLLRWSYPVCQRRRAADVVPGQRLGREPPSSRALRGLRRAERVRQGPVSLRPHAFALARLRPVDVRAHLARAAGDPALARSAVVIVITGIPWRTTWKYGERGWRHIFWDAGSLLANLLAVAAAHGVPARLVFGFVDREVNHTLGIDGIAECAVAVVPVGEPADEEGTTAEPSELDELRLEVEPLSPHPLEFPLVVDAQHATNLDGAEALANWRQACTSEHVRWLGRAAPETLGVPHHGELRDPMETLILRRGSTRLMARWSVPRLVLTWALSAATRPVPADAIPFGHTLLTHELAIHGVEGHAPGLYEWVAGML